MMRGSQIRKYLHDGRCTFGTHVTSLGNPVAAALEAEMELDFAFFCTEHMPLDRTEISRLCQLYLARGISPIVRVPSADDIAAASGAIDGGAEGIVAPYVETVQQVRALVGAVKYRPIKGKLLEQFQSGKTSLDKKTQQFLEDFNKELYLIIGVESVPAIENLEELITIDGVDSVFLGPHDITTSMGIPTEYDNPLFVDTIEDVIRRCRKQKVGVGLHMPLFNLPDGALQRFLDAGMNWLINGADVVIMRNAMNQQLDQLRQMTKSVAHEAGSTVKAVETCITA